MLSGSFLWEKPKIFFVPSIDLDLGSLAQSLQEMVMGFER